MNSRNVLFLTAFICVSLIYSCDDPPPTGGCPIYNHVFIDELHFSVQYDSISLFFCAGEFYPAPIGINRIEDTQLTDSLIIYIHAYGRSYMKEPNPFSGSVWYADSLVVWYSGYGFSEVLIETHFGPINRTPPCPDINEYWIDFIQLRYPEDLSVTIDSIVRN